MKKIIKIISCIALALIILCHCNFAVNLSGYNDVPDGTWFTDSVIFAKNKGFIVGYNSTTFGPHDKLTRGQFVTILWRIAGKETTSGYNWFRDVNENAYYGPAVKWASYYGIVKGYNSYEFGTNDPITRQDFAVILNRFAGAEEFSGNYVSSFEDENKVADYAKTALKWANYNGIIMGKGGTRIDPKANTTRAETAAMLERFYKKYFVNGQDLSNMTMSQKNALKSARTYITYMAFSKEGLIRQLEFEEYSTEDARFAVENLGIDWREQALKDAKLYLKYSAFSYARLLQQLEFDKYTHDEAVYAVDNCGANWYEQAAKCAKQYLDYSGFSRQGLIDQLEFEGFTHEQAIYGVEANGY